MAIDPKTERAELIARLLALQEDVERYLASLARRSGDEESLEDKVQAVMTACIASLPNYRPERADLKSWVLGIATNIFRDEKRAGRRRDARFRIDPSVDAAPSFDASPEHIARIREIRRKVSRAVDTMPETLFAVLLLVGIEGASHAEAARVLGISVEASKKRLEYARDYIKKETGLHQDELNSVLPLLFVDAEAREAPATWQAALDDEAPTTPSSFQKLLDLVHRGGHLWSAIMVGVALWPPSEPVAEARHLALRIPPLIAYAPGEFPAPDVFQPSPGTAAPNAPTSPSSSTTTPPPQQRIAPPPSKIDIHPTRQTHRWRKR